MKKWIVLVIKSGLVLVATILLGITAIAVPMYYYELPAAFAYRGVEILYAVSAVTTGVCLSKGVWQIIRKQAKNHAKKDFP